MSRKNDLVRKLAESIARSRTPCYCGYKSQEYCDRYRKTHSILITFSPQTEEILNQVQIKFIISLKKSGEI